ncbi:MAG: site-specific integrase [Bacteroidales bacterium]|nr:site-specific integrase [Bacteroidales bacterium]
MATVKFLLKQPYKTTSKKYQKNSKSQKEITGDGKKKAKILNPFETRLYCVLIIDRDHVIKIKTEYMILPKDWDFSIQGKKENLAGSIEFNNELAGLKTNIYSKYKEIIKQYPDMPFNQVAETLKNYGKIKEKPFLKNEMGFFDVLDEYIIFLEGEVAPGTIKKYVTLKKSLQDFINENRKYKNLTFSMINHSFKDSYIKYLRDRIPKGRQKTRPEGFQRGLLNDTIGKYIETLKTFCGWASESGRDYNKFNYYKEFKVVSPANRKREKQEKDIITLTLSELKQFYSHDFSNDPCHDRVRDLFCFGAFTGQRWSDIERFEMDQLKGDVWTFTAFKTNKETEIDLAGYSSPALDILRKYNYQLPKISLVKFNKYLKDAGEIAGLTTMVKIRRYVGAKEIKILRPKHKFLSSHTARKTTVSILLNDFNVNITHVLEITGHTDLKTLQKYINKDRQARREAISKTTPITEIMKITHKKEAI